MLRSKIVWTWTRVVVQVYHLPELGNSVFPEYVAGDHQCFVLCSVEATNRTMDNRK